MAGSVYVDHGWQSPDSPRPHSAHSRTTPCISWAIAWTAKAISFSDLAPFSTDWESTGCAGKRRHPLCPPDGANPVREPPGMFDITVPHRVEKTDGVVDELHQNWIHALV
jgi:hypothetical protein